MSAWASTGSFLLGQTSTNVSGAVPANAGLAPLGALNLNAAQSDLVIRGAISVVGLFQPELAAILAALYELRAEPDPADTFYDLFNYTPSSGPPTRNALEDVKDILSLLPLVY